MTVTADQLREAMVQVSALEQRVESICNTPIPVKHPVNFDANVSALFMMNDMTPQTPTWVNGGPDFWCTGVGYNVFWTASNDRISASYKLHDVGNGLSLVREGGLQLFDFRWGMTKMSNARGTLFSYLTAPGSIDSLMSRQALGNQETGRTLRFHPWKIDRGDSVIFTIKPIGYGWGVTQYPLESLNNKFTVLMTMYGFRDQAQRANP